MLEAGEDMDIQTAFHVISLYTHLLEKCLILPAASRVECNVMSAAPFVLFTVPITDCRVMFIEPFTA